MKATRILMVLVLLGMSVACSAGAIFEWDGHIGPFVGATDVSEAVRTVPAHEDDGGRAQPAIPGDSVSLSPIMSIMTPGVGVTKGEVETGQFRIGVRAEVVLAPHLSGTPDNFLFPDIQERNYQGNPGSQDRGYGTALTFWGADLKDYVVPVLAAEYQKDKNIFGLCYRVYHPRLKNGWDRYNDLQGWKSFDLGSMPTYTIYYRRSNSFTFGWSFASEPDSPFGKVKFGGLTVGYGHTF